MRTLTLFFYHGDMKKHHTQQKGFITLFFILGLSFTFLTWISLSSERVFEYIRLKVDFADTRKLLHDTTLCADAFVDIMVSSQYNLTFVDNSYTFKRVLYFTDDTVCIVTGIQVIYQDSKIKTIHFRIGDFAFEYQFKNGFVDSIKSFNIF